jgi:hypothetical protein
MCALKAHNLSLLEKGQGGCEIFLYILNKGGCECFLFYFGSWVVFCVMTHFCFGLVCKVVVKVQK